MVRSSIFLIIFVICSEKSLTKLIIYYIKTFPYFHYFIYIYIYSACVTLHKLLHPLYIYNYMPFCLFDTPYCLRNVIFCKNLWNSTSLLENIFTHWRFRKSGYPITLGNISQQRKLVCCVCHSSIAIPYATHTNKTTSPIYVIFTASILKHNLRV